MVDPIFKNFSQLEDLSVGIVVIGLGYVGLPLAIEFGKRFEVIGFDIDSKRIDELKKGHDRTKEIQISDLKEASGLILTDDPSLIRKKDFYIVTVPTPVDAVKRPDLRPLEAACKLIGSVLTKGSVVVFESTVYPGATEEFCVPILENLSGLVLNKDFYCGYSPERINPGDREHTLTKIKKITSGSTYEAARFIDKVYQTIISAGTHLAPSIRVAEAAKVIENTQRDINIALMNELSIIFDLLDLDTHSILEAAGTKWNFLPFRPGLVGGHCIGVDPYYLTYKAELLEYHPQVVLAGRRINDGMGKHIVSRLIFKMLKLSLPVAKCKVLVMGLTFKENCSDIRNTRVIDIVRNLKDVGAEVDVYDPNVDPDDAFREYGLQLCDELNQNSYDAIVIAVAHDCFLQLGLEYIRRLGKNNHVVFDVKAAFENGENMLRL